MHLGCTLAACCLLAHVCRSELTHMVTSNAVLCPHGCGQWVPLAEINDHELLHQARQGTGEVRPFSVSDSVTLLLLLQCCQLGQKDKVSVTCLPIEWNIGRSRTVHNRITHHTV